MEKVKQIRDGLDFLITQAESLGLVIEIKTNFSIIWVGLAGSNCLSIECQVRIDEKMKVLGFSRVTGIPVWFIRHT